MPLTSEGACIDKDCGCMLCRELKDCKMATKLDGPQVRREGVNFILRRGLPFTSRAPSKEWLEVEDPGDAGYDNTVTLESKDREGKMERVTKIERDVAHKTVIYFGDSNQRQSKACSKEAPSQPVAKEDSRMKGEEDEGKRLERAERQRSTVSLMENEEAKVTHEIVVNVSPSREDVLRIEEDESQVEDYWSLPGDSTGFKADWSFVQQWRLRG